MSNSPALACTFHVSWPINLLWNDDNLICILLPEHSYSLMVMRLFLCGGLGKPFKFKTLSHLTIYSTKNMCMYLKPLCILISASKQK